MSHLWNNIICVSHHNMCPSFVLFSLRFLRLYLAYRMNISVVASFRLLFEWIKCLAAFVSLVDGFAHTNEYYELEHKHRWYVTSLIFGIFRNCAYNIRERKRQKIRRAIISLPTTTTKEITRRRRRKKADIKNAKPWKRTVYLKQCERQIEWIYSSV